MNFLLVIGIVYGSVFGLSHLFYIDVVPFIVLVVFAAPFLCGVILRCRAKPLKPSNHIGDLVPIGKAGHDILKGSIVYGNDLEVQYLKPKDVI